MFRSTAHLYDAFYRAIGKDYAEEVRTVLDVVRSAGVEPSSILDVACGTGGHLEAFSKSARCAGVDIEPSMVEIARRRCPDARVEVADMTAFDLGEEFDLVVCLFSSIGYVETLERLFAAVAAMGRHVAPGGALLIEPWFQPDEWQEGRVDAVFLDEPGLKGVRLCRSERRDNVAVMAFRYLVAGPHGFASHREEHELTLFTWDEYRRAFAAAGFESHIQQPGLTGRGLIVARRRGEGAGDPIRG